jgi:hypothetical protein
MESLFDYSKLRVFQFSHDDTRPVPPAFGCNDRFAASAGGVGQALAMVDQIETALAPVFERRNRACHAIQNRLAAFVRPLARPESSRF